MLPEYKQFRGSLVAEIEPFLLRIVVDKDVLHESVDLGNDVIVDNEVSLRID